MTDARQIRSRLRYAWTPFFARFGNLTQVQIAAIPLILDGRNVIIASPTATGKTEAVIAPLAERLRREQWDGLSILYITPTRALANDLYERLASPLQSMDIELALRHGDSPYLKRRTLHALITTPESLDSLLCRQTDRFTQLRAVVLDEIHLLDNTYRGDQLRILPQRPRATSANAVNTYLVSATLTNPQAIAARYVDGAELVNEGSPRAIVWRFQDSYADVVALAKAQRWRKLLVFRNKREAVEVTARELTPLWAPYPVVVHHGSLSRQVREAAETEMKHGQAAIGIATSTLEIGIDIGDIDAVILGDPPWSVSSLLQRIGRGNRRTNVVHAIALPNTPDERLHLQRMFELAQSGALPEVPYQPDLSVVVQQVFSLLYQTAAGVDREQLHALLTGLAKPGQVDSILTHLVAEGWIVRQGSRYLRTERLSDLGDKGKIHSNIPDTRTFRVIDCATGKQVGEVFGLFDRVFLLAGRVWRVEKVVESRLTIEAQFVSGGADPALFKPSYNQGAFAGLLPESLRGLKAAVRFN